KRNHPGSKLRQGFWMVFRLGVNNWGFIKVIKRKAFGFRNFNNFKKRILMTLNIKKESTNFVLSRL
ncbi:transposase, partial [Streptococcus pneumoniae]|uniref:transposase n=1 Tax=Streptococcus pneumoniae TaxID=1313 RepID=UPI002150DD2A